MFATRSRLAVTVIGIASVVGQSFAADIGTTFTYTGYIEKPAGTPVNSTCDFRFRLYDAAAAGNLIGVNPSDALGITVTNGLFQAEMDFGAAAIDGTARWIAIEVKCTGDALFIPLDDGPDARFELTPTPHALALPGVFPDTATGRVGIGTNVPTAALHLRFSGADGIRVEGDATGDARGVQISNGGGNHFLYDAQSDGHALKLESAPVRDLALNAGGPNEKVRIKASNGYMGIGIPFPEAPLHVHKGNSGSVQADTNSIIVAENSNHGYLTFLTPSNTERGILFGQPVNDNANGGIIYNPAFGAGPVNSLQFRTGGNNTRMTIDSGGHVGIGTATPAYPLHLEGFAQIMERAVSSSTVGTWLELENTSAGGKRWSLISTGQANSQGAGKLLVRDSTDGVVAMTLSGGNVTIASSADNHVFGMFGQIDAQHDATQGGNFAIRAESSGQQTGAAFGYGLIAYTGSNPGYAVYSNGNFGASGTKSFCIDHPLDPGNKYLLHYSMEGPEPFNVYRGRLILDDAGNGTVILPEYFESINRDVEYQLTAIGQPMPTLHVAEEVHSSTFKIAGGAPRGNISWTVTAVRNDPWVQAHESPVVREKTPQERGKYLQPELYDKPGDLRIRG